MKIASSATIHPTAILSDDVEVGENTQIGPYSIVEGRVCIGPDCQIGPHVHLIGELVIGRGNAIGTGTILGARPQHLGYKGAKTSLVIGENNIIREYVTVHGSFVENASTNIGNDNFLMVDCHIGHDCVVGNNCIFVNGVKIAGHATIHDRAMLSGNAMLHQFGTVGKLALLSGGAEATKDVPPFSIIVGRNEFAGVNIIGMRRAGYAAEAINAVRKAYRTIYVKGLTIKYAVALVEQEQGDNETVQEILQFIRQSKRGVPGGRRLAKGHAEAEAA